ncbi:unnamed protein product [Tenebrio molitor]|nr:unnamed protein product [Tenebrio molitor]
MLCHIDPRLGRWCFDGANILFYRLPERGRIRRQLKFQKYSVRARLEENSPSVIGVNGEIVVLEGVVPFGP